MRKAKGLIGCTALAIILIPACVNAEGVKYINRAWVDHVYDCDPLNLTPQELISEYELGDTDKNNMKTDNGVTYDFGGWEEFYSYIMCTYKHPLEGFDKAILEWEAWAANGTYVWLSYWRSETPTTGHWYPLATMGPNHTTQYIEVTDCWDIYSPHDLIIIMTNHPYESVDLKCDVSAVHYK